MSDHQFHFSLGRMLVLVAVVGVWLAALGTLSVPWIVWLGTVVVYLAIVLCFSAHDETSNEAGEAAGQAEG